MSVTLYDVAKDLGISRCTVSRAINNNSNVNEETRLQVQEAIERLGYKPNKGARALVKNRRYRVAALLFSQPAYFWNQVRRGLLFAAEELRHLGFELDIFESEISHPAEQARQLSRIWKEYDGLIVAPNDPDVMAVPIQRVSTQKPVVLINTNIPSIPCWCYVGCDYVMCGKLAGEIMGKLTRGDGKIAMLGINVPVRTVQQRIEGFRSAFPADQQHRLLLFDQFDRSGDDFTEIMARIMQQTADIEGIYAAFSVLPEAAAILKNRTTEPKIRLVGNDLNQEIAAYLQEGIIDVAITHEPFAQGYFPVKILMGKLFEGLDPAHAIIQTKAEAVFSGNIDCYLYEEQRYATLI